jgi:hypothetical protein
MTRFTDGARTVEITMHTWNGNGYDPDWSSDCFEVGGLKYDFEKEAYIVRDVQYLIDVALDWERGEMEYEDEVSEEEIKNRAVDVEEI